MRKKSIILLIILAAQLLFFACLDNDTKQQHPTINQEQLSEELVVVNKTYEELEDEQIDDLLARYQWNAIRTKSGLRYVIYKEGLGNNAVSGDIITLKYSCKLINGDEVYNSDNDGVLRFLIGKGDAPAGLHEAALLLQQGDKAKIVVPSRLGYRLLGDRKNIPLRSTLIYDVEVIEISKQ